MDSKKTSRTKRKTIKTPNEKSTEKNNEISTRKRNRPLTPDLSPMGPLPTKKIYHDLTRKALFNFTDEHKNKRITRQYFNDSFSSSFNADEFDVEDEEEDETNAEDGESNNTEGGSLSSTSANVYKPGQAIQKIFEQFNLEIEAEQSCKDNSVDGMDLTDSGALLAGSLTLLKSQSLSPSTLSESTIDSSDLPNFDYFEVLKGSQITSSFKFIKKDLLLMDDILKSIELNNVKSR